MIDATGKEIIIGKTYGYSKQANGFTRVITGIACNVKDGKVTLKDIVEKTYIYVYDAKNIKEPKVKTPLAKRTLASVQVFPIK